MSTIHCFLTKWGVVWYIQKGLNQAGMETVRGLRGGPPFLQRVLGLPLDPVCPFPCSEVGWIKCVRLFSPIMVVNVYVLGTSSTASQREKPSLPWQALLRTNTQVQGALLITSASWSLIWIRLLGEQSTFTITLDLAPETIYSNVKCPLTDNGGMKGTLCGRLKIDSQWQNTTQKNSDDLDWRTAGKPVLRGKSQYGSPVWSEEPNGQGCM